MYCPNLDPGLCIAALLPDRMPEFDRKTWGHGEVRLPRVATTVKLRIRGAAAGGAPECTASPGRA